MCRARRRSCRLREQLHDQRAAHPLDVVVILEQEPERGVDRGRLEGATAELPELPEVSDRLGPIDGLGSSSRRNRWTNATTRCRRWSASPGTLRRTISISVASDG
jgi:hypothetical protein